MKQKIKYSVIKRVLKLFDEALKNIRGDRE